MREEHEILENLKLSMGDAFPDLGSIAANIGTWDFALKFAFFRHIKRAIDELDGETFHLFPISAFGNMYMQIDDRLLAQVIGMYNKDHKLNPKPLSSNYSHYKSKFTLYNKLLNMKKFKIHAPRLREFSFQTDGYGSSITFSYAERKTGRKRKEADPDEAEYTQPPLAQTGRVVLAELSEANLRRSRDRIQSESDLIGIGPGKKDFITAVRSNDPSDNVSMSAGYY